MISKASATLEVSSWFQWSFIDFTTVSPNAPELASMLRWVSDCHRRTIHLTWKYLMKHILKRNNIPCKLLEKKKLLILCLFHWEEKSPPWSTPTKGEMSNLGEVFQRQRKSTNTSSRFVFNINIGADTFA